VSDARFDFMEGGDAFALEMTATGLGEDGFRHETILNPQRVFHRRAKIRLNLTHTRHAQTIMLNHNPVNARTLMDGARLSQPQRMASQIDFEYNWRASAYLHAAAGTAALRQI
jgi:hypothetical protein